MEYENFDNSNATDADYFAFVALLSRRTADELRSAKNHKARERTALCRYYKRGKRANLTPDELVDFIAVSDGNILEVAGYSDDESVALMHDMADTLTDAEIENADLTD